MIRILLLEQDNCDDDTKMFDGDWGLLSKNLSTQNKDN